MPGSTDRFYVHCYTKRMFLFMQQGIPRNFLLHKNSGRFYSCRRFHHILHMCAVFTAASFLSFAVSAIIHRVLRTVPCAVLAAVFRTVLAVSALVLCLIVGLGLAALHVVVHIIAVSCHFFRTSWSCCSTTACKTHRRKYFAAASSAAPAFSSMVRT